MERTLRGRRQLWEEEQLKRFETKKKGPPDRWQHNYPITLPASLDEPHAIPATWLWLTIGQCFKVAVGATPKRDQPDYWGGSVPWVSSGEVQFCHIAATKEHITELGLSRTSTQVSPAGSVLLGMIGEGRTRGQAAILDIPAANNQNCAAIWVSETDVLPDFVFYWLCSRYEETRGEGSGNNQPALNKSLVEAIPLPLPPVNEQLQIVREAGSRLSLASHVEAIVAASQIRSTRLRQVVLRRAFEGRLAPQDPSDERASVLLERIKAERACGEEHASRRRTSPGTTSASKKRQPATSTSNPTE